MQFNKKLINDLREGKCVLRNEPRNEKAAKKILEEADGPVKNDSFSFSWLFFEKFSDGGFIGCNNYDELISPKGTPIIPIADFLIPEPRFKKGDLVKNKYYNKEVFRIEKVEWSEEENAYFYSETSGISYSESSIDFAPAEAYTEQQFKTADYVRIIKNGFEGKITAAEWVESEGKVKYTVSDGSLSIENVWPEDIDPAVQFEIGQQYEFSVCNDWVKGTLLGIVDNQYKYIALVVTNKVPLAFDFIRPIQPRKISRYINVCPDGRVLRKSYETEQEARDKACHGGMGDCKQVKLEGVIS